MDSNIDEVFSDFKNSISKIDFSSYNPNSPEFTSALYVGLMWYLLQELKCKEVEFKPIHRESEKKESEKDEISDELFEAKKYLQKFLDSGDVNYKDMSSDKLKHANILIKKSLSKLPSNDERARLKSYEDELNSISRQLE